MSIVSQQAAQSTRAMPNSSSCTEMHMYMSCNCFSDLEFRFFLATLAALLMKISFSARRSAAQGCYWLSARLQGAWHGLKRVRSPIGGTHCSVEHTCAHAIVRFLLVVGDQPNFHTPTLGIDYLPKLASWVICWSLRGIPKWG